MSNLGLWGKNPCFVTLLIFHLPLLTSLMLQLVVGAVIAEVVVVVTAYQSFTHLLTPPMSAHSSPSHTLPWSVFTLSPRFWVCWLLTHRLWEILVSRRNFLGIHELLKHPRTVIRVLATVLFIHGKNRSCFLLTQGLYGCASSCRGIPSHFPSSRLVFCWIYPRSISLGEL